MNIVFVSNYFNHHQSELSKYLFAETNGQYTFIQTSPMHEGRIKLGWKVTSSPFVKTSYETDEAYEECMRLIRDADVVIAGSAPEKMLRQRIRSGKLTFRYSERIFKKRSVDFPRLAKYTCKTLPYRNKNLYYLCSSAYAAKDYTRCGAPLKKCYRWGYFPKVTIHPDIDTLISEKTPNSILWVGRLISYKHPEAPIEIAKRLKADGYTFSLSIIGSGNLEEELRQTVAKEQLEDCVHILGSMSPDQVRAHMEQSEIFLFTSDRNEGWGAVLNESMNSACAVAANHAIGSVPYLIENETNGLIYRDGDIDSLYEKTRRMLDCPEQREKIAKNAYTTMLSMWNAETAAKRLVQLADQLLNSTDRDTYESGPCSPAEALNDHWF